MERNPSPPPDTADGDKDEDVDAIGDTVYSKHWLFSTLTHLIHVGRPLLLIFFKLWNYFPSMNNTTVHDRECVNAA